VYRRALVRRVREGDGLCMTEEIEMERKEFKSVWRGKEQPGLTRFD
jgi:hypothetical protein